MNSGWKPHYMALIGLLARQRKELRISQIDLAKQLKVRRRSFQRWEDGRVEPPAKRLFQWAAALGVTIAPDVAQSSVSARTVEVDEFISKLREANCWSASLPLEVLVHVMAEDDKSAFIAWFEGRQNFDANDWATLLILVRMGHPTLFRDGGV